MIQMTQFIRCFTGVEFTSTSFSRTPRIEKKNINPPTRLFYTSWFGVSVWFFSIDNTAYITQLHIIFRFSRYIYLSTVFLNEWCFRPRFWTVRLYWARDNLGGLLRWILFWIMPLVQDRLLDQLTISPARYHCTTAAPTVFLMRTSINKCENVSQCCL